MEQRIHREQEEKIICSAIAILMILCYFIHKIFQSSKETPKKQYTAQDKQDAILRREKVRKMVQAVAKMTEDQRRGFLSESGQVPTCEGRLLSPFNSVLLAMQMRTLTMVGGYRQWLKSGRQVKKGQHGAMIWVPIARKLEKEGEEATETNFILQPVFDISQTQEIGHADQNEDENQTENASATEEIRVPECV